MQGVQAKEAGAERVYAVEKVAVRLPSKAANFFAFVLQIATVSTVGYPG